MNSFRCKHERGLFTTLTIAEKLQRKNCCRCCFNGYLRKMLREAREAVAKLFRQPFCLFTSTTSHHNFSSPFQLLMACAIKIHGAHKQRRYHAKSAFTTIQLNVCAIELDAFDGCKPPSNKQSLEMSQSESHLHFYLHQTCCLVVMEQRLENYLLHFVSRVFCFAVVAGSFGQSTETTATTMTP